MSSGKGPVHEQGASAKELGLTEFDCPYGPGENRDAWMAGFGAPKEQVTEPTPPPAVDSKTGELQGRTTREADAPKGRKGKGAQTQAVVERAKGGETSLTTKTTNVEGGAGAEVTIGDPGSSTTRAQTGGAGMTTGVNQEQAEAGVLKDQPGIAEANERQADVNGPGPTGNAEFDVDPKSLE